MVAKLENGCFSNKKSTVRVPTALYNYDFNFKCICKCLVAISQANGEEKHHRETCTLKKVQTWKTIFLEENYAQQWDV